jgi:hypothetical protein
MQTLSLEIYGKYGIFQDKNCGYFGEISQFFVVCVNI